MLQASYFGSVYSPIIRLSEQRDNLVKVLFLNVVDRVVPRKVIDAHFR